jgi:hypothetical protein
MGEMRGILFKFSLVLWLFVVCVCVCVCVCKASKPICKLLWGPSSLHIWCSTRA